MTLPKIPLIVWLAALIPRIAMFALACRHPLAGFTSDSPAYTHLATSLWRHHLFTWNLTPPFIPETFRVPGYPFFLIPFVALFKNPEISIALAQCVLGVVTVLLTWTWLSKMTDERGAMIGALVMALDLVILFHTPLILTETVFTFVEVLALLLTWRALANPSVGRVVGCGLLWGIAILTKPVVLLFPLLLCWLWVPRQKFMLAFLLAAYLLPGAWVVRNGVVCQFWSLTSQPGQALLEYPAASVIAATTGKSWDVVHKELIDQLAATRPGGYRDDVEKSQIYKAVAMPIIKSHPFLVAKECVIGATRILAGTGASLWFLYFPTDYAPPSGWSLPIVIRHTAALLSKHPFLIPIQLAYALALLGLYVYFVVGCIRLVKGGRTLEALILLVCTFYLLLAASHQGTSRFRIPMMPFMAAGLAVAFMKKRPVP